MSERILRLYALLFAVSGAVFVAAPGRVYAAVNLAAALLPGAAPLVDAGPGIWLVLTGSMMAMIAYLCLEVARDPGQDAAWTALLLSKGTSTALFVLFAALRRDAAFLPAALVDGAIFLHLRRLRSARPAAASGPFASRLPGEPGPFYEVWFAKLNDPGGNAAWLRYTVTRAEGGGGEAACWFVLFDKQAGRAIQGRWSRPLALLSRHDGPFDLEGSAFREGRMTGRGAGASWDFSWSRARAPVFAFVPRLLSLTGLAASEYVSPVSLARFDGVLRVEGRDYVFRGAPGSVGHVWGRSMAEGWSWAHAAFGESVFEILSAQVRLGPLALPRLTCAHLWHEGRHYRSVGLWEGFRNESVLRGDRWRFRARMDGVLVEGECAQAPAMTAGLEYRGPDGRRLVCRNSKTGSMTLRVGGRELRCDGAAAVEFVEAGR